MNMKYFLWISIIGLFVWCGCSDDSETLLPSEEDEYKPMLATGHDYDKKIREFYDSTGVYILYRFTPAEVYGDGGSQWAELFQDTTVRSNVYYFLGEDVYVEDEQVFINGEIFKLGTTQFGYSSIPWFQEVSLTGDGRVRVYEYSISLDGSFRVQEAKEEYVSKQLDWVNEMFLHFYPISVLRDTMPLKIILGRNLVYEVYSQAPPREQSFRYSFHNMIFSHGDESMDELTNAEKNVIKKDVNYWFITERLASKISLEEFYEVSAAVFSSRPSANQLYGLGMITQERTYSEAAKKRDFQAYITAILQYSREQLEAEPVSGNFDYSGNYTGILHPKKDTKGKIRQKYEILLKEFQKLGIDLTNLGELYNEVNN